VCDALIDRQIVHIYHVKFNIVNKNMRISYIYTIIVHHCHSH